MKKLSLSFLALSLTLMLAAEPIGKNAALYTAKSYMLAKGKSINQSQKPFKASPDGTTSTDNQQDAYYYVFNAGNDGGYVIVSGDDRIEPILGYVDQGTFDPENIPENMRSWLQLYADQIKYVIDNNIQADDPLIKKRNKVAGTKHSVAELLMSRWNQGKPYNLTCPDYYTNKDNDAHHFPASGCAATALAQVINYYKYPDKTKAKIPSHSNTYTLKNGTKKTITVPDVPKGTVIDWENMRDAYSCNDSHVHDAPDTAVANLMLYCGQALKMGWGASSGADTSKSRDALVNYFGFDSRAYWASRPNYSIDEWFDMLYNEMEAGFPVLYRGHSSGGGHAFVIDGFDGDNLFHVNWGWGGGSNGWFLIGILNPGDSSGMGASSSSDGYSMTQGGVFNLRVPGTPKTDPLSISDVTINSTRVSAKFTNKTGYTGTFHACLVKLEDDGTLSLVGTKQNLSGMEADASQSKTFAVANRLPEGTHRLSPASKSAKSNIWVPKYNMLKGQYIEAIVDSLGGLDLHFKNPTKESICIDTIVFPGTRIVGQEQEVKVTFRNDGAEYFKTIYFFASDTNKKVYTESKSQVAVRSGESVDVSYFFKPDTTGIYNLWFCTDDKGNNVMGEGTMEVISEAEATKANLAISSYSITNGTDETAYGKRLIGKAKIKNNGSEDYHGRVKLQLWSQKVGSNTAYSGTTRSFQVDIVAGMTESVDFEFENLSEGYYYRIKAMYGNQDGTLSGGGIWDHRFEMKAGILTWKADGTVAGQAYSSSLRPGTTVCGLFADCSSKISRVTPVRNNPNIIYAFAAGMAAPKGLDASNAVYGNHANAINLVNDLAYYIPISFDADSASFTYTFPETENGTKWHAFTMPFKADSIFLDDELVMLEDTLKHFWIYEFAAESKSGELIFRPATVLRAGTPYIIAADSEMAGRSIVFRGTNVPFFKTGTDKMLITSANFKFHGNTIKPKLKDCYILNEEGTAFDYVTTATTLEGMASYFTTTLPEGTRPESIVLPDIPVKPIAQEIVLDEMVTDPIIAGTYGKLTLKRSFEAGYNTICLPFRIESVQDVFGLDVKAYEFKGFVNGELNMEEVETLDPGHPYIIFYPEAVNMDFDFTDITIEEENTKAGFVEIDENCFYGTYAPIFADNMEEEIYGLTAEGKLVKLEEDPTSVAASVLVKGFRAFFELDYETGIKTIEQLAIDNERQSIYNLAGQHLSKMQKGINIVNGRKVLK